MNINIHREKYLESKITPFFKLLLLIFSLIMIFVSVNSYIFTPTAEKLNKIFFLSIGFAHFFSVLDLLVILISMLLIMEFRLNYSRTSKTAKFVFAFAIICYVLKMVNPNNSSANPIFGLPLFSDISNYTYLLFLGTILFISNGSFVVFIKKLFPIISAIVIIRCIILFGLWLAGKGNYLFWGVNSILLETDTLLIFAFFQNIFFVLYLIKNQKKYLICWGILLLIQIMSFRRSAFYVAFLTNIAIYAIYYIRGLHIIKKGIVTIFFILILFLLPNILGLISGTTAGFYLNRYLGIFYGPGATGYESDSGHFLQSRLTTESVIRGVGFWGEGYGSRVFLEGACKGYLIHNIYASLWARYGVYMVVYYFTLFLVAFGQLIGILKNLRNFNLGFSLVKVCIVMYFLFFMVVTYFIPSVYVESTKMFTFLILLFGFILKFTPENYELLFHSKYIRIV